MKVALVFAGLFSMPTGVSRYISELASHLATEHEVHLVLSDGDFTMPGVWIHSHRIHQHPLVQFNPTTPVLQSVWHAALLTMRLIGSAVQNTRLASSVKKEYGLDIIHVQSTDAFFADVVTFHGCYKSARKKHRYSQRGQGIRGLIGSLLFTPYTMANLFIEWFIATHSRKIITVSEELRDEFVVNYGIPRDRITVIPLGVDIERFKPDLDARRRIRNALDIKDDETVAIFVGHLFEAKGLDLVLEAIRPLSAVHLVVIGEDRNLPLYRKRVESEAFGEKVIFIGSLREGIEQYYAAADMFVLPSQSEGFCLAAIEAMASGLPAIVTPVGELPYLIEDGVNGYLIDRNATAIRERILNLTTDPHVRQEMGLNARQRAMWYSWKNVTQATLKVYHDVLTSRQM